MSDGRSNAWEPRPAGGPLAGEGENGEPNAWRELIRSEVRKIAKRGEDVEPDLLAWAGGPQPKPKPDKSRGKR